MARIKGTNIRPTSDRVREALFDILGQDLKGFLVLDLFAGTGILGIESLSRGAERAVFVDVSSNAVGVIRENISLCGYETSCPILRQGLPRGLVRVKKVQAGGFNLVFIDPPYGKGYIKPVIYKILELSLMAEQGTVIVETSTDEREVFPSGDQDMYMTQTRRYGSTLLDIYCYHGKGKV